MGNKLIITLLVLTAIVHAYGILLPETGFDALWYHLPITQELVRTGRLDYIPTIYQSALPRLGSLLFAPFFALGGSVGVKLFTYAIALLIPVLVYALCRRFVTKTLALALTLAVFTFHTIAWQATSAYVDTLRLVFELVALLVILRREEKTYKQIVVAGIFLGLAVSTKLVALFFLPVWWIFLKLEAGWKKATLAIAIPLLFLGFWVISTYQSTHSLYFLNFIFSVQQTLAGTGKSSLLLWLLGSVLRVPLAPIELTFHAESFTTPAFLFAYPFFLLRLREMRRYRSLVALSFLSLPIWYLILPVSARYGLLPIVVLLLVLSLGVEIYATKRPAVRSLFIFILVAGALVNLGVRVAGDIRSLPFVLGRQTEAEYLKQYDQGILRGPLEKWYGINDVAP